MDKPSSVKNCSLFLRTGGVVYRDVPVTQTPESAVRVAGNEDIEWHFVSSS